MTIDAGDQCFLFCPYFHFPNSFCCQMNQISRPFLITLFLLNGKELIQVLKTWSESAVMIDAGDQCFFFALLSFSKLILLSSPNTFLIFISWFLQAFKRFFKK